MFFVSLVEVCSSSAHGPWPHRYFQALLALLCLLVHCPRISSMRPCLSSSLPAARLRVTAPGFIACALGGVPRPQQLPPLVELSLVVAQSALGRLRSALSLYATLTARDFFLSCFFLHFQSIHLHFFQNLSQFFPVLACRIK